MADLNLTKVDSVLVTPNRGWMDVEVLGVSQMETLEGIEISYAVEYFGSDKLLEEIGRDAAISFFNIEEVQ